MDLWLNKPLKQSNWINREFIPLKISIVETLSRNVRTLNFQGWAKAWDILTKHFPFDPVLPSPWNASLAYMADLYPTLVTSKDQFICIVIQAQADAKDNTVVSLELTLTPSHSLSTLT